MDLSLWGLALLPFISAGAGAYLGGYLKKKGENLATHEDIEKLKEQVRVVTTTTKEIEAKISDEVWNRQKRWELKREVLFEASKRLAQVEDQLMRISVTELAKDSHDDRKLTDIYAERREWIKAMAAFDMAHAQVALVCGTETVDALNNFRQTCTGVSARLVEDNDSKIYENSLEEIAMRLSEARTAMRKELGIESAQ